MKYLPAERDWVHIDKHWVCDVLYTLDADGIQAMVDEAMAIRKDKLEHNRDLIVEMRPEFATALQACMNFSSKYCPALTLYS